MLNNLKKIRESKGLTQFELGIRANMTPSEISRLENGRIYFYPGWKKRLAEALGVTEKEICPND